MSEKTVIFDVELSENEAMALAQFFKRAGLSDYQQRALDDDEAYKMQEGGIKLQKALEQAGFNPR